MKNTLMIVSILFLIGCASAQKDGLIMTYYDSGVLRSVQNYNKGTLDGISREYYETGVLKHAVDYRYDQIGRFFNSYHPDGTLWLNEIFENGVVKVRREYDEEGLVVEEEYLDQE